MVWAVTAVVPVATLPSPVHDVPHVSATAVDHSRASVHEEMPEPVSLTLIFVVYVVTFWTMSGTPGSMKETIGTDLSAMSVRAVPLELLPATSRPLTVRVVLWPSVNAVVQLNTWLVVVELSGLQPVVVPVNVWL